jgi:adenylyltransferase/sulfurtransferase
MNDEMDDQQLLRYSRQIMLPSFDIAGQQSLRCATVLVVGAGGLGSPVAMYLAAAGVGRLLLADHDHVDLSNLQRQLMHTTDRIGMTKVESARLALQAINPGVEVVGIEQQLDASNLPDWVAQADVVVDASDNFATRFALNRACVEQAKPLVSGAAIRLEGQVSVFAGHLPDAPCYRCLYSDELDQEADDRRLTCSENGVLSPVVGVIGSLQATETIKVISGLGETLIGRLLIWDAAYMQWRELKVNKDPACPVCSG